MGGSEIRGGPHTKDYSAWGSVVGVPYLGKLPCIRNMFIFSGLGASCCPGGTEASPVVAEYF